LSVAPMITNRNTSVITISLTKHENKV
jgi:hypothetical protein